MQKGVTPLHLQESQWSRQGETQRVSGWHQEGYLTRKNLHENTLLGKSMGNSTNPGLPGKMTIKTIVCVIVKD